MDKFAQKYDLSGNDLGDLCVEFVRELVINEPRLLAALEAFAREHAPEILGREIFVEVAR